MIKIKEFGFRIVVNQMVIGIWKSYYESEFGNVVNQIVIGFWKSDYESWKFETEVVLKFKWLFIIIPISKFISPS